MNPQAPRQRPADSPTPDDRRASLSALADGEADAQAVRMACEAWRDDAEARRTWHAYQLIGDVLRSDELASRPSHDAAFLTSLRARLEREPVVLAPEPRAEAPPRVGRRPAAQRWLAPAAIAAGFVAVAGVLVVTRMNPPDASGPRSVLASSRAPAGNQKLAAGQAVVRTTPSGLAMVRDAQLDDYINAHQAARRGGAVVLPGIALRSVEMVVPVVNQP
jgi:sigma-E factor negative regulatory protein RseA